MTAAGRRGTLFLLPTLLADSAADEVLPAGVIRTAHAVRHFLAEDARSARAFLKTIAHPVPLQQLGITEIGHAPDAQRVAEWLQPLVDGADAALLSDAGCPAVADPGDLIVAAAHAMGLRVRPLVGPNSILLALMASGFSGQHFRFVGYLPRDAGARADALRALEAAARRGETQLFIETPYRNAVLFESILATCGAETRLALAIDLTGPGEEIAVRRIAEWRALPPAQRPALQRRPAIFALASGGGGSAACRRKARP
jgi:16S rRNA (cytidine1402-2'-O)-methyltransferase